MIVDVSWFLSNPEVGWVVIMLYLIWEIRGPKGAVKELKKSIHATGTVVRALARVQEDVDTEKVDGILTENGHEPNDFIQTNDFTDEEIAELIKQED